MAAKRLTPEEMLQVSASWVDPKGPAKKAILACPETAPIFPRLQAAHDVLAAAAQPATNNPRLAKISAEQTDLDARHDDIIRGAHGLLSEEAVLLGTDEGEPGVELIALRDFVIPDGLESVKKSYRAESGQAKQLEDRITPEVRATLESIVVGKKSDKHSLAEFVDEWIRLAKRLGVLEDEKDRLVAKPVDDTSPSVSKARNGWVRIANALVANAELGEVDEQTMTLLFAPMRAAEALADRRGRGKAAEAPAKGKGAEEKTPAGKAEGGKAEGGKAEGGKAEGGKAEGGKAEGG